VTDHSILRAGVIGAGVFGGHHARRLARTPGVELTAVFDRHLERAQAIAAETGAVGVHDLLDFLSHVDVVSITTPAIAHHETAKAALNQGLPTYVEKPLATTLADGDALVNLAVRRGVVLACGHQERAVFAAMGLTAAPERPLRIESVRRGTRSARNKDVSCVLDLMIHDLDLALLLSGAEPIAVEGEGGPDGAVADVTFASGMSGLFESARAAEVAERRMTLTYPSGTVEIDFLARTFRNTTSFALDPDFAETPAGRDPLGASLDAFLAAVRGSAPRPLATGAEALAALDLALAVEQAAGF
jgi:predicted dehydrogenase